MILIEIIKNCIKSVLKLKYFHVRDLITTKKIIQSDDDYNFAGVKNTIQEV